MNHVRLSFLRPCGLFLLALGLWACGGDTPLEESPWAYDNQWQRGPVELHLRLSHTELTIADTVQMELEAVTDQGVEVTFPDFGENLEQFIIEDYAFEQPRLAEDGKVHELRRYTLEPFLAGEYALPEMTVGFVHEGKEAQVLTEALTLTVNSLMPEDIEQLEIRDIALPADVPPPPWPWWQWVLVVGSPLLLVALLLWFWRRRREPKPAPKAPAHETAYARLRLLVEKDLVKKGRIKAFYNGVSNILRDYIEDRYGLRAPERTTEEFLQELKLSAHFEQRLKDLLANFLTHCDLVKFALHSPGQQDIQSMFDAAKDFIEATRADRQEPDQKGAP